MQTRRALLSHAAKLSVGLALGSRLLQGQSTERPVALTPGSQARSPLPPNFIGLGYEMSSVASVGLLSPVNARYVNLVSGLGREGVLRVGGIVADYTRYDPKGTMKATPKDTVITRASLEQFGRFLNTIGWRAIWSVNFAQGSIEDAVEEARSVAEVLGSRLLCLELGNEVEAYANHEKPFRKPPYSYEMYREEFNTWHAAIVKAVPGIAFAAPDTAGNVEWVERMARDAHGDVQLLTTHYYFSGQNHGKTEDLLYSDPRLMDILIRLHTASNQSGIPWRMCETNSFSGGGLPGVSDTFLGALWTFDYMLLLAAYGCSGVNIETGVNQLGFVSSYSPIQDDGNGLNSAGVPYYGMLAFAEARRGCDGIVVVDFPSYLKDVTAYALSASGRTVAVAVINRGDADVRVSLSALGVQDRIRCMRLIAPSPSSKADVTFGGAFVDSMGMWKPGKVEKIDASNVFVPKMSAAVLRIQP
jgi:hypothetical protein